jgi:hypothetical protein
MIVKGNTKLAAARKYCEKFSLKTKAQIKQAIIDGKIKGGPHITILREWCGVSKPKAKIENNQIPKPSGRANNGGARKGSGRKVGAATKKTRDIADKLAKSDEMTPLEYMLQTLRETPEKIKAQHEAGEIDTVEYTVKLQDLTRRRDQAAQNAAPYIHPRLSSIEANVGLKGHDAFVQLMAEMADNVE